MLHYFIFAIYAVCVAILIGISWLFGISYVDSSVYVCEYGSLVVEILVSGFVVVQGLRYLIYKKPKMLTCILLLIYDGIAVLFTMRAFAVLQDRIIAYHGMTNTEIFNQVVRNLREAAASTYTTYEFMNIMWYIVPITCIIFLLIAQLITIKLSKRSKSKTEPQPTA